MNEQADFDPRMTFDTFVVGPANRLASAAARRAAESPGTSYNPLFLYAASGLGKSHILSAIAQHSARSRTDRMVVYQTLEGYLDELAAALEKGAQDEMRERYLTLHILLLDDVQFLTGQAQAQEMLLRTLDTLTGRGAQVVLASDRPPAEINGLDARLLSRFSGGLIVDIGPPDYETRVAIMRKKAEERGMTLAAGVAETMARTPFRNVRELQGALNRVLAVQDLEGRPVTPEDLRELIGERPERSGSELEGSGETAQPLADEKPSVPVEAVWRRSVRESAERAEYDGFDARRLFQLLEENANEPPEGWEEALERFEAGLTRIREIQEELDHLGNPWPEAAANLLRDPDRLEEAEHLLASARERARPFRSLPDGPRLEELEGRYPALALRAAGRMVRAERPDYNPLYLYSSDLGRVRALLEAAGRGYLEEDHGEQVALTSVADFSEEFIRAISEGVAGAWRERWWSIDLLLLYGLEGLSSTERAQEEFFHLFETLIRRGARILLAADRAPARITGVDDRLRSRFEGGLVLDIGLVDGEKPQPGAEAEEPGDEPEPSVVEIEWANDLPDEGESGPPSADAAETDDLSAVREMAGVARGRRMRSGDDPERADDVIARTADAASSSDWFPAPDKVVWDWPRLEDRIGEED